MNVSHHLFKAAHEQQPCSSDDDDRSGALDAYDRLKELSSCAVRPLHEQPELDSPPPTAAGDSQEDCPGGRNRAATTLQPGDSSETVHMTDTDAGDAVEKPVKDCYAQHLEAALSPEQQNTLQDETSIVWKPLQLEGWKAAHIRRGCELKGCFRGSTPPEIAAPRSLHAHSLPPRLRASYDAIHSDAHNPGLMSQSEASFFALCSQYCDIAHFCHPYPTAQMQLAAEESAVLLHAANHVCKKMDAVKKNHERLQDGSVDSTAAQDQGFVRPQVLLLVPMRSLALPIMLQFAALAQAGNRPDSVQGKQQLLNEFSAEASTRKDVVRPADHKAMFSGNSDDHFRVGIKVTQGAVKLFADVYESDIIVASPLALATQLGEGGSGAADYLSSIELLVMFRCDVMQMQNWSHVDTVFACMNTLPAQQHGTDIMRVRPQFLEEQGRLYRQTIILSSFESPELNAQAHGLCNHSGIVSITGSYPGVVNNIIPKAHHLFQKFTAPSYVDAADRRFEHFVMHLWPHISDSRAPGVLLFASSYFDFVRLRNFLKCKGASFAVYSEYTEGPNVLRARMRFANRERRILLYTERAHFYFRPALRGVHEVVFYSLPLHAGFYEELVNMAQPRTGDEHCHVHTLFSNYDFLRLKSIIGLERSKHVIKTKSSSFLFKVE